MDRSEERHNESSYEHPWIPSRSPQSREITDGGQHVIFHVLRNIWFDFGKERMGTAVGYRESSLKQIEFEHEDDNPVPSSMLTLSGCGRGATTLSSVQVLGPRAVRSLQGARPGRVTENSNWGHNDPKMEAHHETRLWPRQRSPTASQRGGIQDTW